MGVNRCLEIVSKQFILLFGAYKYNLWAVRCHISQAKCEATSFKLSKKKRNSKDFEDDNTFKAKCTVYFFIIDNATSLGKLIKRTHLNFIGILFCLFLI